MNIGIRNILQPAKATNLINFCSAMGSGTIRLFANFKGVNNAKAKMQSLAPQAPLVSGSPGDKNHTFIYLNQLNDVKASVFHEPIYEEIDIKPEVSKAKQFQQTTSTAYAEIDFSPKVIKPVIIKPIFLKAIKGFESSMEKLNPKNPQDQLAKAAIKKFLESMIKNPEPHMNLIKINLIGHKLERITSAMELNDANEHVLEFSKLNKVFRDETGRVEFQRKGNGIFYNEKTESKA